MTRDQLIQSQVKDFENMSHKNVQELKSPFKNGIPTFQQENSGGVPMKNLEE